MGSGSFNYSDYTAFTSTTHGKTTDQVYSSRSLSSTLDPKGVKIRESRDSADNPESTPVIVGIDVTGSMGMLADVIARKGLGTLFTEILAEKPISNPHIMFMAIGDANCDTAPLQVSQFEADNRIVDQLTQIYIEHGGGGNDFESYNLPWYFAARHTEHDSYLKRGKRGYLFTIGDEEAPRPITRSQIAQFIGDTVEADIDTKSILAEAQRTYDCYHIMIAEGSHAQRAQDAVRRSWLELMGQHAVWLTDHTKLAETIVSIIEVAERGSLDRVRKFGTAVTEAVKNLPATSRRTPKLLGA